MGFRWFVLGVALLGLPSCATAEPSVARSQFIVAHAHGWVEVIVLDEDVPAILSSEDPENPVWLKPTCSVSVSPNSEPFLREPVFPHAAAGPFVVRTGFRFPVSAGSYDLTLRYAGCPSNAPSAELALSQRITVAEGQVIPIAFNGHSLEVGVPVPSTGATLDSISSQLHELQTEQR